MHIIGCPSLGPAYDLTTSEVRGDSLVLEWKKPVYCGSGPITGYHVDYAKTGSSDWTTANTTAVSHRFLKVRVMFHCFFFRNRITLIYVTAYSSHSTAVLDLFSSRWDPVSGQLNLEITL